MRYRLLLRVVALPLALSLGCLSIGCRKAKTADSPENAVQLFEKGVREGNTDQVEAVMPKREREFMHKTRDTLKRLKAAQQAFNEAMESHFGKSSLQMPDSSDLSEMMMPKKDERFHMEIANQNPKDDKSVELKLKITATDDEKAGTIKTKEQDWVAVKEDDGWKLREGAEEMTDESEQFLIGMFEKQIKRFEQTTVEIKAGKFKSPSEAVKSLRSFSPFGS